MGRFIAAIISTFGLIACGGSESDAGSPSGNVVNSTNNTGANSTTSAGNNTANTTGNNTFVPEVEEFAVRSVASTDRFVFVPNSADEGNTVARISGVDLSVTPIPVGLNPTDVVAFETPNGDSIAVVLVEGTNTAAVIRADANAENPIDLVHLLPVPGEVNTLVASPDGRHVLAYIDPDRPLPADSSVASLQAAALLRIGDTRDADESFELSLTRLIRDVEIVDEGRQIFVVGREGVNRLAVDDIHADTFIPPLPLDVSEGVFPPTDLEVEVAADASFLVLRSSAYAGIALYAISDAGLGTPTVLDLPNIPTDIDLFLDGTNRLILATIRDAATLVLIDVDDALADPDNYIAESIAVDGASAGLAQLTPDLTTALLYSTLPLLPTMGIFDFAARTVSTYPLRNAIRSVAVSPDSKTAVVVHDIRPEAETTFQRSQGLTVVDIATGYRRPITVQGQPVETVMTTLDDGSSYVFVLLESPVADRQGVLRVDLRSFRSDFVPLARAPRQIGLVAGKLFVAQDADDGRITFIDVVTLQQRTVSGYELNAGID